MKGEYTTMIDPTDRSPLDAGTHRRETDGTSPEEHVCTRIAEAIADVEGVDATEAPSPLESAVDTDALDQLFEPLDGNRTREEGLVRFPFAGYLVTVRADGTVAVDERDDGD